MTKFYAHYEDRAKTSASCLDPEEYVEEANQPENATTKAFSNLDDAVAWVSMAVDSELTVFGCGEVREYEPVKKRCRYCICHGQQMVRRHIVSETGIDETFEAESDCC